jgi:CRP-like cAMP-binding protein
MAHSPNSNAYKNKLLAALSPGDLALIASSLERVSLKERQVLETPNKAIDNVYFIEDGIASVVAVSSHDKRIEVGLIGREGVTGLTIILGNHRAPYSLYMQIAGTAYRISAANLRKAMRASASFQGLLLRSAQAFMIQTAHTAVANGRAKLEERLARWILMAHDRIDGDEIKLTHEFLSVMLGVRRAGVTVALHAFVQRGLITVHRGAVVLLDRPGIEEAANSYYGVPEAELKRLLG